MDGQGYEQRLGFSLSGEAVAVKSFIAVATKLTDLLRELETSVTGRDDLEWHIADLRMGSTNFAIAPVTQSPESADSASKIIDAVVKGIAIVENSPQRPPHFTDQALRDVKDLTRAANGATNRLSIFGGGAEPLRVTVSQRLVAHVDELIGTKSVALGSLEGRLEALTVHGSIAFSIYDSITNRRISCGCSRETLNAVIKYFDKRVSVSGEIRFNARGEATSMRVDDVRPLGTGPLPQPEDIIGLFADHKIDTDEWSKFVREKW